jgi:hypothetical protein
MLPMILDARLGSQGDRQSAHPEAGDDAVERQA